LPGALGIHRDDATDLKGYLRRVEVGAERLVDLCRRHPGWPANEERMRLNGPLQLGREAVGLSASKLVKQALSTRAASSPMVGVTRFLEGRLPTSDALERLYGLLIGVHLFRGFRRGLAKADNPR
jgi:hypothetical protein